MRKVCLLGASGSIGTQTLDVLRKNRADFELVAFSVGERTRDIHNVLRRFPTVKMVCIKNNKLLNEYKTRYPKFKFVSGDEGLLQLIDTDCDMVVNALVGFVGLKPSLYALEKNKILALANKESLVVGGELINRALRNGSGKLYPIDSEHSALMKCLMVDDQNVSKLMLTASGGAFRNLNREQLKDVTPEQALMHPTWKMGPKITIDCATMVNKAFEIIEAHYLFNYPVDKIGVKLHDESYVHSYVIYDNGLIRADIGMPDMRKPIKLALYEFKSEFKTVSVTSLEKFEKKKGCHFHDFDINRYPMVKYAEMVINKKDTYGAVFNAVNEEAVKAFLNHEISFLDIEDIISVAMEKHQPVRHPDYALIASVDRNARVLARELIEERRKRV